jgi:hypothetical protein
VRIEKLERVGAAGGDPELRRDNPSSGVGNAYTQRRLPFAANRPLETTVVGASQGDTTSCSTARSTSSFGIKLSSTSPHVSPELPARRSLSTRYASAKASLGERV